MIHSRAEKERKETDKRQLYTGLLCEKETSRILYTKLTRHVEGEEESGRSPSS